MATPQTRIYICSGLRLNNQYEHSIYFENAGDQQDYFAGKVVKTLSAYSYVRDTWPLKVEAHVEEAREWSYLYFENPDSGKFYYFFITSVEYINESTTQLNLEMDVLQTYLFDFDLRQCFVERTHPDTDDVGDYTQDENLELGELVVDGEEDTTDLNDLCILVLSSITLNGVSEETTVNYFARMINGVFSGLSVWAVDAAQWVLWGNQLDNLSEWGKIDGVVNMWMYPKKMVTLSDEDSWSDTDTLAKIVTGVNVRNFTAETAPVTLDGYSPKNNKLRTYPYSFMLATNNNGGSAVYKYERFDRDTPTFKLYGALSPDAGVRLCPVGYNGCEDVNFNEALTMGAYPTCAWNSDTYKLWLAQNQNVHQYTEDTAKVTAIGGFIGAIGSALTGNVGGALGGVGVAVGAGTKIAGQVAAKKDMSIQPPQARGTFSPNLNIANDRQVFTIYHKTLSYENARRIDRYFTMYGYLINQYQRPNICNREAFTYVKTIGCLAVGDLCSDVLGKVDAIFDKGVTFWVDGDQIGNYGQSNLPI